MAPKSVANEKIKEDFLFLRKIVAEDLESGLFAKRGYPVDMLSKFADDLVREIDIETFREIQKTYATINLLGSPSTKPAINKHKFERTLRMIDKTLMLLA